MFADYAGFAVAAGLPAFAMAMTPGTSASVRVGPVLALVEGSFIGSVRFCDCERKVWPTLAGSEITLSRHHSHGEFSGARVCETVQVRVRPYLRPPGIALS